MKWLTRILGFLFLSTQLNAYEGFRCIPSIRDTRLQVMVRDNQIEALITNGMGYEFMPQFEGPSSAYLISFNKMQAADLKDIGDMISLKWPKEKCTLDTEKFTLTCSGIAESSVKSIEGLGLTTTEITEKYETETYAKRKFRFSLHKDNYYFVSLVFDIKNCEKL